MRHIREKRLSAFAAALLALPVALSAAPASAVTGTPSANTTYAYAAQITVGDHDRACSGVLVDREWLLTAASCFVADPVAGLTVPTGKPALKTTATIGRADLSGTGGAVREIVELVPRTDRDAVLARLNRPVTNVTPVALATMAPTAGEELTLAGFGRSTTEWAPLKLHTGAFSVDASATVTATVTGKNGAAACMGDSGGPLVRTVSGTARLAALSSRSYQGGCFGIATTETRTGGIATRVDDLASWVNSKTGAVRITDFNCDGVEDIAVGDPQATVGGDANAGLVRIVYGGGKGTAEINQNLDWVPGATEASDWFGESLATVDHNEDGCTDLVVGAAGEDIGAAVDAGTVDVLYGAPGGLGTGTKKNTHFEQGVGSGAIGTSTAEAGDRMGDALAAGTATATGEPYLIIGVPGESLGTLAKAGVVYYLRGTTNISIGQDNTNVPDTAGANDGFGGVVAADGNHFVVGSPGEAVGSAAGAGMATVFNHTLNSEGRPTPRFGLDQDLDAISGGADAGDQFGSALAMVPYRPSGAAAATESILAVGVWGEDLTIDGAAKADAGAVLTFRIPASGTFTQFNSYLQGTDSDDVTGTSAANDNFGWAVTAVNTAPREVSTTATMRLAVGVPQETVDTASNAGVIHTFSLLGAPGANDRWLKPGDGFGIPGTPGTNQYLGASLHFTGTNLYVGMPNGPSTYGALYALPMANVTAGATPTAITTYRPGTGGLPSAGVRFGWTAR